MTSKHINTATFIRLRGLIRDCDAAYRLIKKNYSDGICGIPILWFGDMNRYLDSKFRVITFGINPSSKEFVGQRFPDAARLVKHCDVDLYERNYNGYFERNCYCDWFCGYSDTLAKFNAGFCKRQGRANCAIHIDGLSPIATSPAWSEARKNNAALCKRLKNLTQWLFKAMIETCEPDLLVTHIGKGWLQKPKEKKRRKKPREEPTPEKADAVELDRIPGFETSQSDEKEFYVYTDSGRRIPVLKIGNTQRGRPMSATWCDLKRQIEHHRLVLPSDEVTGQGNDRGK